MKVALVFTGLLRCWEKAYPSISKQILERYNPDVFFNIWSEVGYYSGKAYQQSPNDQFVKLAENDRGFHADGKYVDISQLVSAYHPVSIQLDDFSRIEPYCDAYAKLATNAFTRPKNTYAMFLKIYEGVIQATEWASRYANEYDLIIRMRPDLALNSELPELNPEKFYTIRHRNKHNQGTGDGFQAGNSSDMSYFANTVAHLPNMYGRIGVSCPHLFTAQTIIDEEFDWQELAMEFVTEHSPNGPYQEPDK